MDSNYQYAGTVNVDDDVFAERHRTSGCRDGSLRALSSFGPSTDDTTFEAPSPRASRH
jgi:hypothetical protein